MRLMPVLDSPLIAARLASWHNRHPLARRISAEAITGFGVVALPFAGSPGVDRQEPTLAQDSSASLAATTLRQRAQSSEVHQAPSEPARGIPVDARARAFDEDFLPGVSPHRAATFAARLGAEVDPSNGTLPRRELLVSARREARHVQWRFVWSAAIESHDKRVRVLFCDGAGSAFRVIGPRIWAPGRIAIIALAPSLTLIALGAGHRLLDRPVAPAIVEASAPATGASDEAASSPRSHALLEEPKAPRPAKASDESAGAHPLRDEPAPDPSATMAAASAAPMPEPAAAPAPEFAPPAGGTRAGEKLVINLRPRLDPDLARKARQESAAARAGVSKEPARTQEASASSATQRHEEHIYAVVARATRTRAASQVMLGLMQATVAGEGAPGARADVLPSEQGYRASWWPFVRRADAEQARDRLAKLGVPVDIVEF